MLSVSIFGARIMITATYATTIRAIARKTQMINFKSCFLLILYFFPPSADSALSEVFLERKEKAFIFLSEHDSDPVC